MGCGGVLDAGAWLLVLHCLENLRDPDPVSRSRHPGTLPLGPPGKARLRLRATRCRPTRSCRPAVRTGPGPRVTRRGRGGLELGGHGVRGGRRGWHRWQSATAPAAPAPAQPGRCPRRGRLRSHTHFPRRRPAGRPRGPGWRGPGRPLTRRAGRRPLVRARGGRESLGARGRPHSPGPS